MLLLCCAVPILFLSLCQRGTLNEAKTEKEMASLQKVARRKLKGLKGETTASHPEGRGRD